MAEAMEGVTQEMPAASLGELQGACMCPPCPSQMLLTLLLALQPSLLSIHLLAACSGRLLPLCREQAAYLGSHTF